MKKKMWYMYVSMVLLCYLALFIGVYYITPHVVEMQKNGIGIGEDKEQV